MTPFQRLDASILKEAERQVIATATAIEWQTWDGYELTPHDLTPLARTLRWAGHIDRNVAAFEIENKDLGHDEMFMKAVSIVDKFGVHAAERILSDFYSERLRQDDPMENLPPCYMATHKTIASVAKAHAAVSSIARTADAIAKAIAQGRMTPADPNDPRIIAFARSMEIERRFMEDTSRVFLGD